MRLKALLVGSAAVAALGVPSTPAAAAPGDTVTMTLTQAIADLPVAAESRDGYERTKFRHWVDADRDGCNTRAEVLLEEAVVPPSVGSGCRLSGGRWDSWYDGRTIDGPAGLDIDHKVPLAEAWDSGASAWSAQERQDYANDVGDGRALDAVTAQQNRQKADQDPATWLPADAGAYCRYVADWAVVKTRWDLSADPAEVAALLRVASGCPDEEITVVLAR
ncbi:HNH endonuclease family protein [Streptomyces sp. NPDC021218]|uniref:HNH endonuclease family protein n=1 Tax=unclassified Streptomyces TaxID=2593676 RepID=UPI0036D0A837